VLQVQIQAKLDKYQRIKSKIKRYPLYDENPNYSEEELQSYRIYERGLFGNNTANVYSPSRIQEIAHYCKIRDPLVFCQAPVDNYSILESLKQKNDELFFLASSRYQNRIWNVFDETLYSCEDVVTPFLESQKILENALFYSQVICACCEMMLAFIEQREVSSHYERILKVSSLKEIEMLHNEPTQKITPEMLKHISDTLIKKRSYRSFLADYIQEIIDDLSDLLAISNHAVIFQRSTASLAQSLFKEASRAEECTLKHVFK